MRGDAPVPPLATLVRLALDGEDPAPLVAAVQPALGPAVALAGAAGDPLAAAPDDARGRRAMAVAAAVAVKRLATPPGWSIAPIVVSGGPPVAFLAIDRSGRTDESRALLELLEALLAEQLQRALMLRSQRHALLRALITGQTDPAEAIADAQGLGMIVARAYWPALLVPRRMAMAGSVLDTLQRTIGPPAAAGEALAVDGRLILLYPDGPAAEDRRWEWLHSAVGIARSLAPAARVQGVAAETAVHLADLGAAVAGLVALPATGSPSEREQPVVLRHQYALERLLSKTIVDGSAASFIEERLGTLIRWDREHGSDLVRVLEAALDYPVHEDAARHCFMHRNTFRTHLHRARRVVGDACLDDPEARLATRVALKLHRLAALHTPEPPSKPSRSPRNGRARRRDTHVRGQP